MNTGPGRRVLAGVILESACLGLAGVGPLVFVPGLNDGFELPKQVLVRVILLVAVLGSFASAWGPLVDATRSTRPSILAGVCRGPVCAVLLLVLVWTLSTAASIAPAVSLWGTYQRWAGLVTQVGYAAVFLVAAYALRSPRQMLHLAIAIAVGASLVAMYAIAQWLGWDFVAWSQGVVWGWQPASGRDRPFSTLGNPDFLGAYLTLALFVTYGGARASIHKKPFWWLALGLQIIALVLSQCRSAWLGVGFGIVLLGPALAWATGRNWRRWAVVGGAGLAGAAVLVVAGRAVLPDSGLVGRLPSIADPGGGTATVRLLLWRAAAPLVLDQPLLGSGPDTFGTLIVNHYPPELWRLEQPAFPIDRAHNALLETLITQGLLGALATAGVISAVAICGYRFVRRARLAGAGLALPVCVGAALVAHLVEQQLNVEITAASMLAWLLAGAIVGLTATPEQPTLRARSARFSRSTGFALSGLAAFVVAALGVWGLVQPLRADWTYAAGLAAERTGDLAGAQAALTATTDAWPREPVYWNELARARMGQARAIAGEPSRQAYRAAVVAAEHGLALNPASTQLLSNWSLIAAEAASRTADRPLAERAASAASESIARAPEYWLFWRSAGATAFNLGDYTTAETRLTRAAQLFDGDVATWSALGDAAVQTRDVATARDAYQRTLELMPNDTHARDGLARLVVTE